MSTVSRAAEARTTRIADAERHDPGERPTRVAITVLGMHRSGTSAVARALSLLGATLPRNLMPPWENNELGHWEPQRIVDLIDELLADASSAWDDVSRFPTSWYGSSSEAEYQRRLVELLDEEYDSSPLFVLKDPRLSRLVPFWLGAASNFGVNPSFVLVVRNPLEVAASLKKRDGFSFGKGLLLWLRHMIDAERDTRGHPRAFVSYARLLADWESEARSISQQIGVAWPQLNHRVRVEVERFLDPVRRHHEASTRELREHSAAVSWVTRVYETLERACAAGEVPGAQELDEVGTVLDEADAAYGPLLAEAGLAQKESEEEVQRLTETLTTATEETEGLREQLAERSGLLERSNAEAAKGAEQLDATRAELAASAAAIAELREQLELPTAEVEGPREEVVAVASDVERLRDELAERTRELDLVNAQAAKRAEELELARAELVEDAQKSEQLRGRLDQQDRELEERGAELGRMRAEIETSASELGRRDEQIQELRGQLDVRVWEVEELQDEGARLDRELRQGAQALEEARSQIAGSESERRRLEAQVHEYHHLASELAERVTESEQLRDRVRWVNEELGNFHTALESVSRETALAYLNARPASKWRSTMKLLSWVLPLPRATGRRYFRTYFALRKEASFDFGYYLASYPDIAVAGENALMHYIEHGAADGRDPNAEFRTAKYLSEHPELKESGENPLLHYLRARGDGGAPAGRR